MVPSCPHCGASLPRRARFCRECGSDERTGWAPEDGLGAADPPDAMGDAEYEEFLAREFPSRAPAALRLRRAVWLALVGLVLLSFVLLIVLP